MSFLCIGEDTSSRYRTPSSQAQFTLCPGLQENDYVLHNNIQGHVIVKYEETRASPRLVEVDI